MKIPPNVVLVVSVISIGFIYILVISIYNSRVIETTSAFVSDQRSSGNNERAVLIYIYKWPDTLTNCWPDNFTHSRLSFEPHFADNYFMGKLMNDWKSLYHTHQYSLYQYLFRRIQNSIHYTTDPVKASHFLIPYDLGRFYYFPLSLHLKRFLINFELLKECVPVPEKQTEHLQRPTVLKFPVS
jgi:hypothetical protein